MTKAKKISLNEWNSIGIYNPAAKWIRPFCSYSLVKTDNGFRRDCRISWPLYLLLFIPVHLIQALYCMWDGGLKELELASRYIGSDYYTEHGENYIYYEKVKELWERA